MAPEILEGTPYDTQADMWSLGVIVYILLGGYPPFIEQNQRELFRKIRKGQFEFHEGAYSVVCRCGCLCARVCVCALCVRMFVFVKHDMEYSQVKHIFLSLMLTH